MRKLYVGAALTSLQPLVLSALMLPATAYVIRGLGPEAYGQWMTASALVAFTMFATNLGLRVTFVRAVARNPEQAAEIFAHQMGARFCLAIIAAAVAMLSCLAMGYSHVVVVCTAFTALGLVITTLSGTAGDLLQGFQRLDVVAAANMAAGLTLQGLSVAAVILNWGPIGVSIAYMIGPVVSLVFLLRVVARQHFKVGITFDFKRMGGLFWEARYLAGQSLVHSASTNAEALMLPKLVSETGLGMFGSGTLLSTRLGAIPDGLASALYPAVVEADTKNGPRAVVRLVGRFLALGLVVCFGIAIGVTVLAGPFAQILVPAQADIVAPIMRITIWLLPVMLVLWVLGAALNGLNGDAEQAKAAVIAAVVNLTMTTLLVWKFGLMGACWSMLLRYIVWLVIFIPCSWGKFRPVLHAAAQARAAAKAVPALEDR